MSRLNGGRKFSWRYALGELLLITLGIYLAFAVNNWGETRKERKLEQFYLSNLLADIDRCIQQIHWHRVLAETHRNGAEGLDALLAQGQSVAKDSLILYLNSFNINPQFKIYNTSYQSILQSGDYRIIKSDELRKDLDRFFLELLPEVVSLEEYYQERLKEQFFPIKESVYMTRSQTLIEMERLFDSVFRDNVFVLPAYIDQEDRQLIQSLEAAQALKARIESNID